MEKHFVTFFSPGTFVSEADTHEIDSWDANYAQHMARTIFQRHGARPYGFQFSTRGRGPNDLDSKVISQSGMYFLGGAIETLAEVKARADPSERILLSNMEGNGYDKIIINTNSWKHTAPFVEGDTLLDFKF